MTHDQASNMLWLNTWEARFAIVANATFSLLFFEQIRSEVYTWIRLNGYNNQFADWNRNFCFQKNFINNPVKLYIQKVRYQMSYSAVCLSSYKPCNSMYIVCASLNVVVPRSWLHSNVFPTGWICYLCGVVSFWFSFIFTFYQLCPCVLRMRSI